MSTSRATKPAHRHPPSFEKGSALTSRRLCERDSRQERVNDLSRRRRQRDQSELHEHSEIVAHQPAFGDLLTPELVDREEADRNLPTGRRGTEEWTSVCAAQSPARDHVLAILEELLDDEAHVGERFEPCRNVSPMRREPNELAVTRMIDEIVVHDLAEDIEIASIEAFVHGSNMTLQIRHERLHAAPRAAAFEWRVSARLTRRDIDQATYA
jgi:hypothetical protein